MARPKKINVIDERVNAVIGQIGNDWHTVKQNIRSRAQQLYENMRKGYGITGEIDDSSMLNAVEMRVMQILPDYVKAVLATESINQDDEDHKKRLLKQETKLIRGVVNATTSEGQEIKKRKVVVVDVEEDLIAAVKQEFVALLRPAIIKASRESQRGSGFALGG